MDIKLKYCFNCGAELVIKGSKFCYNCGQDLRVENLDFVNEDLILANLNQEFIFPIKQDVWKNNIWDYWEAEKITEDVTHISDVCEYWATVKSKLIGNDLFEGNFIKWDDYTYWMPIDDIPLNLARIEMLIHNGFIEVKIFIKWCERLYSFLKDKSDSIEKDLGFKLRWVDSSEYPHIVIYNLIDMNNKDLWDGAMKWHISVAERIYEVFSPLMKDFCLENPDVIDFDDIRAVYWKELDARLPKSDILIMDVHHHWLNYPLALKNFGWKDAHIVLKAYKNNHGYTINFECNSDIYKFLISQKREIEKELGTDLIWKKGGWYYEISTNINGNVKNKNEWEDALNWHVNIVERFKKVFIPRIDEYCNR